MKMNDFPFPLTLGNGDKSKQSESHLRIGNQQYALSDSDHEAIKVGLTELGLEVLSHLEDMYLRLVRDGYVFHLTYPESDDREICLEFLQPKFSDMKSRHSRIAVDATTH